MTTSTSDALLAEVLADLGLPAPSADPISQATTTLSNAGLLEQPTEANPEGWTGWLGEEKRRAQAAATTTPPAPAAEQPGPIANMPARQAATLDALWNHPATQAAIAAADADPESIANLPAPAVPAGPPPSTVEVMRGVLDALDRSRPRSMQTRLGPSELGTPCQRQIAYKLAGVERRPEDKRPPWAPMQGTAMHTLMEEALHFHNRQLGRPRWVVEETLEIDPGVPGVDPITGHGDAFDTDTGTVVDWKYVGVTTLREVARKTVANADLVKPDYRVQGHLYGRGHERAGRDVRWVRLVFLARSHDYAESREWTEAYDREIAEQAILRYYGTHDLINALGLAANPDLWDLVPAAPGKACDWCPFRRAGGPADGSGCPGNTQSKIDNQLRGLLA